MSHLIKMTHHITVGRQGFGETHYALRTGAFASFDAMEVLSRAVGNARKGLLGSDASMDGCSLTLADPDFFDVPTAASFKKGRKPNFVRRALFDNVGGNRGLGTAAPGAGVAKSAAPPWLGCLLRFVAFPDGSYNRTLILRGLPLVWLPYDPANAGAPDLPVGTFLTALNAYIASLAASGTLGAFGILANTIDATTPPKVIVENVEVLADDPQRRFIYTVTPGFAANLGDWLHLANIRGPGLEGASGTSRLMSIEGNVITTQLRQPEPCDIVYVPNSGYLRVLQWTFHQYAAAQYERTVKRDTGLPYVHTKGRQRKRNPLAPPLAPA